MMNKMNYTSVLCDIQSCVLVEKPKISIWWLDLRNRGRREICHMYIITVKFFSLHIAACDKAGSATVEWQLVVAEA